ncbi:MAG: hypothetical protein ACP5NI_10510 [Acetobacteraceae bacterium]
MTVALRLCNVLSGAALGLAVLGLAPRGAGAAVHTTATAGAWNAFRGTATDGHPLCGVSTFDDPPGSAVLIKYFRGDTHLVVQLEKQSWAIPRGAHVPVRLRFDQYSAWTARATGAGRFLELTVGDHEIRRFLREFRLSYRLTVRFPAGNEPRWHTDLTGTNAIVADFADCVGRMRAASAPTQPYVAPAPIQPLPAPQQNPAAQRGGDSSNYR